MNENDKILTEKLEQLNSEYLNSGYYDLGKYIKTIMKLLKQGHFLSVFRLFILHLKGKKNKKKQVTSENITTDKYVIKSETGKKIAIYTCITGSYDQVEEPLIMESGCDYFLFTNNKNLKSTCFEVKEIPENIAKLNNNNNVKINRYIKMHPAELFEGYDYSIYIDGNIKLVSTISRLINNVNETRGIAIHKHSSNNCISKEIIDCRAYGKGNYKKLKAQVDRYLEKGFPKEYGMLECNVLVLNLKNKEAVHIFDDWWKEYLSSESGRDQIALPYVLWKNNVKVEEIGTLGENINKNPLFKINSHV